MKFNLTFKLFLLTVIFLSISSVYSQDINKGLKAYWSFDKLDKGEIPDLSGNGNNAIPVQNPTFPKGILGNCIELNGNNYAVLKNMYFMDKACDVTFTCWVYFEKNSNNINCLFVSSDNYRSNYDPFAFTFLGNRPYDFSVQNCIDEKAIKIKSIPNSFSIENNKWYFITVMLCLENNKSILKFFLNGKLICTETTLSNIYDFSNIGPGKVCVGYDGPLTSMIGALNAYPQWNWVGKIDEMRFYDRCLSNEEQEILMGNCQPLSDSISIVTGNIISIDSTVKNKLECRDIQIKNKTNKNITISGIRLKTAKEFSLSPGQLPFSISPGQEKSLRVCFLSTEFGEFKDSLFLTNDCSQMGVALKASVKCPDIINDISISFASVIIDSANINSLVCREVVLKNISQQKIGISSVQLKNANQFILTPISCPFELKSKEEVKIMICFIANEYGIFTDSLSISNECSSTIINLLANVKCHNINNFISVISDKHILIDSVDANKIVCKDVLIKNASSQNFTITNIKFKDAKLFSINNLQLPLVLLPNQEKLITICFTSGQYGTFQDSLVFENGCSSFAVDSKANVIDPCSYGFSVDVYDSNNVNKITELQFDSTSISGLVCKTIIIKNNSIAKLTIANIKLADGINYILPNLVLPIQLLPGETKFIIVCFNPKFAGEFSDKLIFENSCGNTKIDLTGFGADSCLKNFNFSFVGIDTIFNSPTLNIGTAENNETLHYKLKIVNNSSLSSTLSSANFNFGDNFELLPNQLPLNFIPFEMKELEFVFKPKTYGVIKDLLTLKNSCSYISLNIIGENLDPCVSSAISYIVPPDSSLIKNEISKTYYGETTCKTLKFFNNSEHEIIIDKAYFRRNYSFSYPHSQLPLKLKVKDTTDFMVCYSPRNIGIERDTLYIGNYCDLIKIPFYSTCSLKDFQVNSNCDAEVKLKGTGLINSNLLTSEPYPNPAKYKVSVDYILLNDEVENDKVIGKLSDVLGNIIKYSDNVFETKDINNKNEILGRLDFNVLNLTPGLYYLVVSNTKYTISYPFLISN